MNTLTASNSQRYHRDGAAARVYTPSPRLKLLFLIYLFFLVWAVIMPCLMVISIMEPPEFSLVISVAALLVIVIALVWIRKYSASIRYLFTPGMITRQQGVLFRTTTTISCDLVHRVSSRKGFFQRLLGFWTMDLLTNDPSEISGSRVLLSITGVENPQELERLIDSCRNVYTAG